jgi:hypothetical protein
MQVAVVAALHFEDDRLRHHVLHILRRLVAQDPHGTASPPARQGDLGWIDQDFALALGCQTLIRHRSLHGGAPQIWACWCRC